MLNYDSLQDRYGGEFIAVLNDAKVVAHGTTFNDVVAQLHKNGDDRLIGTSIRIKHIRPRREVESTA